MPKAPETKATTPEKPAEMTAAGIARAGLLTRAQAAKRLRVSYNTITRREANGDLVAQKINGIRYYDATDVDEYADNSSEVASAQLLRASKDIIQAQMEHNARILEMSAKVAFQLLELQSQTTVAQRERIAALEAERETMRQQVDDAHTTQHARDLDLLREEAKMKMQADGFEILKTYAPSLLAKLNLGGTTSPTTTAVLELAASLTVDQLAAIAQAGVLTGEQIGALEKLHRAKSNGASA